MTSPKPEHSPWPMPNGLLKGEMIGFMTVPKKLSPEELDEFELRAYALLNRRGVRHTEAKALTTFETDYLQLVNSDSSFVVRVCDRRPTSSGIMLFEQAWRKHKATNDVEHHPDEARIALQHMRDLMVLEDLADL